MPHKADRAADIHRENMKKKRREMEQASLDATSDLLDTDSNATFAMVSYDDLWLMFLGSLNATKKCSVKVHFDRWLYRNLLFSFRNHWWDIPVIPWHSKSWGNVKFIWLRQSAPTAVNLGCLDYQQGKFFILNSFFKITEMSIANAELKSNNCCLKLPPPDVLPARLRNAF